MYKKHLKTINQIKNKKSKKKIVISEPLVAYERTITFFNSFEEQAEYELKEMAKLSSMDILRQMRTFINIAYGMHGFNPKKLPKKHQIKIIKTE